MRGRMVGHHSWSLELHRKLLGDRHRNRAFSNALARVSRGAVVADIGAGTGFLSFVALQKEAVRCHLSANLAGGSQRTVSYNQIESLVRFSQAGSAVLIDVGNNSSSLLVAGRDEASKVVSETLGCFALEENLIENMNDARRFLKDTKSILMPCKLRQYVCPVLSSRYDKQLNTWDEVAAEHRLNFTAAKFVAYQMAYQLPLKAEHLLPGGTQLWDEIDFYQENPPLRLRRLINWGNIKKPVYGFCVWWEADLLPGIKLSTSPSEPMTHWEQCYLPLLRPLLLSPSDTLRLKLHTTHQAGRGSGLTWQAQIQSA